MRKFWRRFRRAWWLARDGEIVYEVQYQQRCYADIPGMFEGKMVMERGDALVVYKVKLWS